jgi:general secretion pathway protein F
MLFQVKAARGDADIISLPIEALDAEEAERRTREQGYEVLAVKRAGSLSGARTARATQFPVLLFTQELVTLLEAGMNLVAAIEALAEKESSPTICQILKRLLERLRQGVTFSAALEEFPQAFSRLYIATVRSNERTGGLVEGLTRYAKYQAQMEQVRSKLASALVYPALLFVVGGGVALFLLFYVVPKFRRIFEEMGTNLPFFSRLLVDWGRAVENYGALLFVAMIGAVVAILALLSRPTVRQSIMSRVLALPRIGEYIRIYQFARFYRTLGMLQRSGIPLAGALDIAASLLTEALRPAMQKTGQAVREGAAFSEAMMASGLTTSIAYRLLRVSEHSGNMPEMLDRIASFHEERLSRWVEWFTRLFEPLLMAVIGVVIGLIVVFLYMPIFELAGAIQ